MAVSPHNPSILDLPHELIVLVLELTSSVPDLAALIGTAPIFNNVWKLRTASISEAVLSKDIECYPQALLLENTFHPEPLVGFEMTVQRHSRLVKAARCADEAWKLLLSDFTGRTSYQKIPYPIHDSDRPMLKEVFYWLWRVVGTATYRPFRFPADLKENLDQLSRWHILPLCELTVWFAGRLNARLKRTTAKMRNTHLPRDRTRYAYHCRWVDCCEQLWRLGRFTDRRNDHYQHDLHVVPMWTPRGHIFYGPNYWFLYERLSAARQSYERVSPQSKGHATDVK